MSFPFVEKNLILVSVQVLEISHSKMRLVIIEVIMFGYLKEESCPFTFQLSFEFSREIKSWNILFDRT